MVQKARDFLLEKFEGGADLALVLGSGLSSLSDEFFQDIKVLA